MAALWTDVMPVSAVSVTKEEYGFAPRRPTASDKRCTTLPPDVWNKLVRLNVRGAVSCAPQHPAEFL